MILLTGADCRYQATTGIVEETKEILKNEFEISAFGYREESKVKAISNSSNICPARNELSR
ncbi:Protein BASIC PENTACYSTEINE6 [Frankliniella fusca]|uniref:Protein BASIC PENTACYSTEINE6 n=1 Tax=Frankliniella fusca TaxID=407009 RepID=A0AAE1GW13_9NEOP|nr:Protein BASIC PENTACYSTEINE6 [Frankliniella fusca]